MTKRHAARLTLACVVVALVAALGAGASASSGARRDAGAQGTQTFILTDFGAVGDGVTDDGPALQAALDALAAAGGGTLFVPAGRYAIVTPVARDFGGLASPIQITGVASDTEPAPPTASGAELTLGLNLTSEFLPRTGEGAIAINIGGARNVSVEELAFVGTPDVTDDAFATLQFGDVGEAAVRHCEFYGLASLNGSIIMATRSSLKVERSVFLGCATSSGTYSSVIQNIEWKGVSVSDTIFADYGQRPELFGKLGLAAPLSWVNLANAAAVDNESPRREAVFRNIFFDEGGLSGISVTSSLYEPPSAPIDLFYVSTLQMNVSNLGTSGLYLADLGGVLVEDGRFGWSQNADSAVNLINAGSAILSRIECAQSVTRVRADEATARLVAIDALCPEIESLAPVTRVFTAATPDDDPTRYVRSRFQSALGRDPDPAAHFYWADRILRCGTDAACVTSARSALASYLASNPQPTFTLEGRVTDDTGAPVADVAVTLAGSQSVSTSTDADGRYHFSNLPTSGVYTVSAEKPHYVFASPQQTVTTPAGTRTVNFNTTAIRYEVSGRLSDDATNGIAGATVMLSGSHVATATTDANGNYLFSGLSAGGSYTLTPSSPHHTFTPASQTIDDLEDNVFVGFNASPLFYTIGGQIVSSDGDAIGGVSVTLGGSKVATATTNPQGFFLFTNVPRGGDYTVTPGITVGYTFSPASTSYSNLTSNQGGLYTGTPSNFKITGRATLGGAAMSGLNVSVTGSRTATATTDANGDYSFTLPINGNYTVTPSKTHYTFAPVATTFNLLGADRTADFAATLNGHTISGRVTKTSGAGVSGVTVTLAGSQTATATTDANGNYALTGLVAGGSYTVTAAKANYTVTPAGATFTNLASDRTADFTAAPLNLTIGGRVTTAGGAALSGVALALTGAQTASATTDSNGAYTFTVPADADYTVTPSKKSYNFTPAAAAFKALDANKTADFAAALNRHTIRGRVADTNNQPLGGVPVALSGSQSATTTTDANGGFSFANLAEGGGYTVTPSAPTLSFSPASQTFNDLGADGFAAFVGTLARYRVNGRVTEKGAALGGVSVELAGTHPALGPVGARLTTGDDGSYSFEVLAGGDYTVTASKKNYSLAPAAAAFKEMVSNQTADFAATPLPTFEFSAATYSVSEDGGSVTVTVTRVGDPAHGATVVYQALGDTARRGADFLVSIGQLTFAPGETTKTFSVFITDDAFVEGAESFTLTLTPGEGASAVEATPAQVTITDNDFAPAANNPLEADEFFIRQHYRDFFSREPDADGLAFWVGEIKKCGTDAACREARRVSVSAAFFLSIEFQETGYLVYRLYRAAYGRAPERVEEFMLDARVMGDGVVVGRAGWEQKLAANKATSIRAFVERTQFAALYPTSMTPVQFVDALFLSAGVQPSDDERQAAIDDFGGEATSADHDARAFALRRVAESPELNQQELNRAFVMMQYFGYLRRNPNETPDTDLTGYNHWLGKLVEFSGNYERAEMVKAFLASDEYRGRFGN